MDLGWLEAIVVIFAMLLASTVFSATGFGIGMISTPLMLLVYEPQTVIVVAGTAGLGSRRMDNLEVLAGRPLQRDFADNHSCPV